jgi:hypothetical protein
VWIAFVDLLAKESYEDLSPLQRKAHLVFWYESEVQNGGHGQYFENRKMLRVGETCEALTDLGLLCHAAILSRALAVIKAGERGAPWEDLFQDGEVEALDEAFFRCEPTIIDGLERHLSAHSAEYVEQS